MNKSRTAAPCKMRSGMVYYFGKKETDGGTVERSDRFSCVASSPAVNGWVYAFVHLSLETACFRYLYRVAGDTDFWMLALLYDAFAFVPQVFAGMLQDRFPRLRLGAIGSALVILALTIPQPFAGLIPLTAGNAMVHVAGAEASVRGANGKTAPVGVFVGAGSFGVLLGRILGSSGTLPWLPFVLMSTSLVLSLVFPAQNALARPANGFERHVSDSHPAGAVTLLIFVTVTARAYVGYAIPTAWKVSVWHTVVLFLVMGAGKGAGGFLADRFGARKTALLSLAAALPLLILGNRTAAVSLAGIFLFSMTMAVSYGILLARFPNRPGFAFGVTTVALFLGSLPAFFILPQSFAAQSVVVIVLTLLALVSFAALKER